MKRNPLLPAGNVCDQYEVAIVLDSSSSVRPANWPTLLDAAEALVENMADEVKWSMVTFHVTYTLQFYLNTYTSKAAVKTRISETNYTMGTTNLAAGMCASNARQQEAQAP